MIRIPPIRMEGADALDGRFKAVGAAVQESIVSDALGASAQYLADVWREVAPYRAGEAKAKTRTLKSGERVSKVYGHGRDLIKASRIAKPRKPKSVVWKTTTGDAFWLFIYEYGKFDQPPRPTFRPATERSRAHLIGMQSEVFHSGVNAVWAGKPVNAKGRNY